MQNYKQQFIDFIIEAGALKFGNFKLKSGRISPYFFNAGVFNTAKYLSTLGAFYAQAINEHNLHFNVLFGPAYKGIPIATSTAIALYNHFQQNVNYCFNRKEKKNHGEGGVIVGSKLIGGVLIIDDVITAGTAINEAITIISANKAKVNNVIVALDRKEKSTNNISAIAEIEQKHKIKIHSIINIDDIILYLENNNNNMLENIKDYRKKYGV